MATQNGSPLPEKDGADLQAECERLRARVNELEQRHKLDQATIEDLQEHRRMFYALLKRTFPDKDHYFTEGEIRDLVEGKDGQPLEAFIGDLERIANGNVQ